MSRLPLPILFTATVMSLSASVATAQTAITGATYNNGGDHLSNGDTDEPLSFTSLTAGGETYTEFFFGSTTVLADESNVVSVGPINGSVPSKLDAMTNDIVNDGLLNTRQGTKIMFDVAFAENNRLFVTDLQISTETAGQNFALFLLDENGDTIDGTGTVFLIGSGGTNLLTYDVQRDSASNVVNAQLFGSVLSLSDFGYSGTTAVRGVIFGSAGSGQFDPMSVGLVAIPEPGSLALMGIAALVTVLFYRRR